MFSVDWIKRRFTDGAQRILGQIPTRAADRGLTSRVPDDAAIVMLLFWCVLNWERKIGLVAIEESGVNRFDLIAALDRLLAEKALELPEAFDRVQEVDGDDQGCVIVEPKAGQPYVPWDSKDLLEPLLCQAEQEAKELGHNYVGSEHLVLAIVKLSDPALRTLLERHGVSYERVREAVVGLLQPGG
jgi:Clp amino terminal domain, pathogenicity island component